MTDKVEPNTPPPEVWRSGSRARRVRLGLTLALVACACLGFALTLALNSRAATAPRVREVKLADADAVDSEPASAQSGDFSRFPHTNAMHARLPCLLCHRRDSNSPQPVRSVGHTPCASCHEQQFADSSSPICTICHDNPQSGAVKPFPPLRSFNMTFDHARHASGASRPGAGCASCHSQRRGGAALSIPAGFAAHNTCFQCHQPRAQSPTGQDISSCGTCHRLGGYSRTPENAAAYRVNFSHAAHTSKGLDCAECHAVRAGQPQRRQVTAPAPLMHHASPGARSCMTCHDDKRAFGGDDFKDCTRCHRGPAWHF
jgi:c(7)-type cytochrome triheme protein